ncbi:unnamed protein product [Commensalibacter communis]|uniref:Uncharacterized protein n=1 Tax=Commensalibacter communis TaxID=2972786 RepID=A0A9W4X7J1_9PROT|nr:hypothetical protein [Commensalibacter communis]CAI3953661.1 unnamed protein product [Commensalibacter communis]CAI3956526.1 unnamed protein product [Commensalibacter communis]CAI3956733.1 unnamed protein product [Commensalibacter communis]CAI3956909.1 unnamed protein product [Commensalibacter communis]
MKTTIRLDTKQASMELQRIASKDIPYAVALGLNGVAKAARDQVKQELPSIFHNTNAFTRNAVAFTPATKNYQTATIFIKDQQAKYLQFEEYGGTRTPSDNITNPSAKGLVVAAPNAKKNASGGLPKGYVKSLAQKAQQDLQRAKAAGRKGKAQSILKITGKNGKPGGFFLYNRQQRSLTRLVSFVSKASYKPKMGFHQKVEQFINKNANHYLTQAIDRILTKGK